MTTTEESYINKETFPNQIGKVFYTIQNGDGYQNRCLSWDYISGDHPAGWNKGDLVLYLGNMRFLWVQGKLKRIVHQGFIWSHHFISIEEYVEGQERDGTI